MIDACVLVVLCLLAGPAVSKVFIMGPASITIYRFDDCADSEDLPIKMPVVLHKMNRTVQALDANLTLPFDLDDMMGVAVKSSKWSDGGWKLNAFTMQNSRNLCRTLNAVIGELWYQIERQAGIAPGACPIKKGTYIAQNLLIDLNKMKVQSFLAGKFKTRMTFTREGREVMCKHVELELNEIVYP